MVDNLNKNPNTNAKEQINSPKIAKESDTELPIPIGSGNVDDKLEKFIILVNP